jgi:hypothetical protein
MLRRIVNEGLNKFVSRCFVIADEGLETGFGGPNRVGDTKDEMTNHSARSQAQNLG